jgi:hypothetical protein
VSNKYHKLAFHNRQLACTGYGRYCVNRDCYGHVTCGTALFTSHIHNLCVPLTENDSEAVYIIALVVR